MNFSHEKPTILFLSRGSEGNRILKNEKQLIAGFRVLSHIHNYELKVMQHNTHWSPLEQQRAFYSASVVIGLHGGSFSNIPFCNKYATIVEINYSGPLRRNCFCNMALALQLNYVRFSIPKIDYGRHDIIQLTSSEISNLVSVVEKNMARLTA